MSDAKNCKMVKCELCDVELEVSKFAPDIGQLCMKCRLTKTPDTDGVVETKTKSVDIKNDVPEEMKPTKTRPPYPNPIKNPYCPGCESGKIKHAASLVTGGAYWMCLDCGYRFKTNADGEIIW